MTIPNLIRPAKILLVAEAPGNQERLFGFPLVGSAGQELARMLAEAGLCSTPPEYPSALTMAQFWRESPFAIANVFTEQPPENNVGFFFRPKKEGMTTIPPLAPGKYLAYEHHHHLKAFHDAISVIKPDLIIAFGNTASWGALNVTPKISNIRGFVYEAYIGNAQVLPTYHPAAVVRSWSLRPTVIADLLKAKSLIEGTIVERTYELWIEPTLAEIADFFRRYLTAAPRISYDIENPYGPISCIGFGDCAGHAICIPFHDDRKEDHNYWASKEEELLAWDWVKKILSLSVEKITQNGLYDISHLWYQMGIVPWHSNQDTMVLHHSLQPEMTKDLGYLGSIYTNLPEWKSMRKKSKQTKKED